MTRQKLTQSFAHGNEITFPPLANNDGNDGTEGPLVIEAKIGGHMIHRMYIDGGSSTEVLYEHYCFNQLRPEIKNQMVPVTTSLTGFSRETIWPLGQLRLLVTIGDAGHSTKAWMNFMIMRSLSPYNDIIGRPRIRKIQAVPSTAHGMLKFPANGGIVTLHRVPRSVAEHQLNVREGYSPVRQKKRGQALERSKAIQAEVKKLVEASIMREVYYHDWLSNPVMDCYPLPKIDWKVESLCGYPFKCFLDAYKGYHQIQMAESDKEKTAFHTSQGVYCYTKMPFGLKNACATYQRLVDKAFDSQVGRNMEVYVDDLVIKSHTEAEMIRHINETFRTLRRINMKLNPKKCTFRAREGMFLGYMISPEGIKLCPDKTEAVLQLPSPRTIKEVQSLNRKLASLNRFLSKSAKKSLPLFKTLKKCIKKSDFHWTPKAKQAFTQLKQHLSELALLVAPKPKEELIVYLAASHGAISAVLMTERATVQMPVYFVSHTLQGPGLNYSPMEKLVLSLGFTAKRLRRYSQAHPIAVITDQPIKQIMSRPNVTRRLQKWSVMLGEHNITYRPRMSVKGQILADFLIEKPDENLPETPTTDILQEPCTLFTNGSSCIDGSRAGWEYAMCAEGQKPGQRLSYLFYKPSTTKKNKKLDALSKITSTSFAHLSKQVLVEILKEKSIHEEEVATVVEEGGTPWMTPIIEYMKDGTLPGDKKEASKLRIKARHYKFLEGILYKRSFLKPWLQCVRPLQADYVIREIHEGSCSMHAG
ncbi:reverse transcriptase domain-containing protein [Tanacetum coccineum]